MRHLNDNNHFYYVRLANKSLSKDVREGAECWFLNISLATSVYRTRALSFSFFIFSLLHLDYVIAIVAKSHDTFHCPFSDPSKKSESRVQVQTNKGSIEMVQNRYDDQRSTVRGILFSENKNLSSGYTGNVQSLLSVLLMQKHTHWDLQILSPLMVHHAIESVKKQRSSS